MWCLHLTLSHSNRHTAASQGWQQVVTETALSEFGLRHTAARLMSLAAAVCRRPNACWSAVVWLWVWVSTLKFKVFTQMNCNKSWHCQATACMHRSVPANYQGSVSASVNTSNDQICQLVSWHCMIANAERKLSRSNSETESSMHWPHLATGGWHVRHNQYYV